MTTDVSGSGPAIDRIREYLTRDENVEPEPRLPGMQAFRLGIDGQELRVLTWDDQRLEVLDGDGAPSLELRDKLLVQLASSGIDLAGVRDPERETRALRRREEDEANQGAEKQLSSFLLGGNADYAILLPTDLLTPLSVTDGWTIAAALATMPEVAIAFVARFDEAHPRACLSAKWSQHTPEDEMPPEAGRAAIDTMIRRLWPQWWGWQGGGPRQHDEAEYVYDTATASFWDIVWNRPLSNAALDRDVPRENWPVVFTAREPKSVPPSTQWGNREDGRVVEGVVTWPGRPKFVRDRIVTAHGVRPELGARLYNRWRPPPPYEPDAPDPEPWLDLVGQNVPDRITRERMLDCFAFVLQRNEPFSGAIVLGGAQGIGKDALLLPIQHALGYWNCAVITPEQLTAQFKPWLEVQLVIISEVRMQYADGGAHGFYSALKPCCTRPPDTVEVNEKYIRQRWIPKIASFVMTTNEISSMFVPPDDRRFLMNQSPLVEKWHIHAGKPHYFIDYFDWLRHQRGFAAVRRHLVERDIRHFDSAAEMPLTYGKRIAQAAAAEGDSVLRHATERLGDPDIFFEAELREKAEGADNPNAEPDRELLFALRGGQRFVSRMEQMGYEIFPHPGDKPWRYTAVRTPGGARVEKQSARAWVKTAVLRECGPTAVHAALMKRGQAWVAGLPRPGVVVRRSPATPH